MKKVIIIGAGPAGLTAGFELLSKSSEYDVTIVEESQVVGGMCARHELNGKNLDLGGHMLISHNPSVKKIWNSLLPAQGVASFDDLSLDRYCKINNGGPDPAQTDNVMLSREKIHRVLDEGKLYESPVRLNRGTIKTFGFGTSVKSGFSQIGNSVFKHKETSLENYYLNRYGKQLYSMFLESYTEKVWGRRPSQISSALGEILENDTLSTVVCCDRNIGRDLEKASAAFANRYYYPKKGISYLFEEMSDRFIEMGGSIHRNCKVVGIVKEGNEVIGINCFADDERFFVPCDILISSMPIKELINGMGDVPSNVKEVVHGISYRGLITFGVEVACMKMKNDLEEPTIRDIVPDSVIYINDKNIKLGRIQVYNNFSPYLINDNNILLGLNYYCNEGDYYWNLNDTEWNKILVNDLINAGIIYNADDIISTKKIVAPKAFPGYFDNFDRLDEVITYLNKIDNLYCVGRNGQHRMSTVDEAMLTAIETVRCITNEVKDKSTIWEISEMFNMSLSNENKLYNSALLGEEGEYRGNYPIQRLDTLKNDNADAPEKPQIRRMRRPMMTPIKKADPADEGKLSEPIIINDRIVIAARPNKTIPIDIPDDIVEVTAPEENVSYTNDITPVYAAPVDDNLVAENVTPVYVNSPSESNGVYDNSSLYSTEPVASVNSVYAPVEDITPVYTAPVEEVSSAYSTPVEEINSAYETTAEEASQTYVAEENYKNAYESSEQVRYSYGNTSNVEATSDYSYSTTADVESINGNSTFENETIEAKEDTLASINEEAASKSIVKSWSVLTSEKKVADDNDIVKPVATFNKVEQFTDSQEVPEKKISKIEKSGIGFANLFSKVTKFAEPKDINATDKVIEKNQYSSYKAPEKVDNFDDVANNYELPPIVEKPTTPTMVVKSEGTIIKAESKYGKEDTSTYNSEPTVGIIKNDYSSIFGTSTYSNSEIGAEKSAEEPVVKNVIQTGYDQNIYNFDNVKTINPVVEEVVAPVVEETVVPVVEEPVVSINEVNETIYEEVEAPVVETAFEETKVNETTTYDYSNSSSVHVNEEENIVEVVTGGNDLLLFPYSQEDHVEAKPVISEPIPQYVKKEVDTSIVFKNARVIKSTKVSSDQPLVTNNEKKNVSSLDALIGNKRNVIAVIKNGEVVPVKEDKPVKEETVKKTRAKKIKQTDEDMVAAPISVVLDAAETSKMTEALEQPKKRGRKRKANTEGEA